MSKIPLRGDDRFTCLWQVYPPQADEPYMQSLSRSGLLELRIETTLQIVSILMCWPDMLPFLQIA